MAGRWMGSMARRAPRSGAEGACWLRPRRSSDGSTAPRRPRGRSADALDVSTLGSSVAPAWMKLEPRSSSSQRPRGRHGDSQPRRFVSKDTMPTAVGCFPDARRPRVLDTDGSRVALGESLVATRLSRCLHPHVSEQSDGSRAAVVIEHQSCVWPHGPTHRIGVGADHGDVEEAAAHDVCLSKHHRDHSRVVAIPVAQATDEVEHHDRTVPSCSPRCPAKASQARRDGYQPGKEQDLA